MLTELACSRGEHFLAREKSCDQIVRDSTSAINGEVVASPLLKHARYSSKAHMVGSGSEGAADNEDLLSVVSTTLYLCTRLASQRF